MLTRLWVPEVFRDTEAAARFSPSSWLTCDAQGTCALSDPAGQSAHAMPVAQGEVVEFCWEDHHPDLLDLRPGTGPAALSWTCTPPREDPMGTLYATPGWPGFPAALPLSELLERMADPHAVPRPGGDDVRWVAITTRGDTPVAFVLSGTMFRPAPSF